MIINIQFLRLVAAFLIVATHLILFGNKKFELGMHELATLAEFLKIGVDIFFVISGFIMVYTTRDRMVRARDFLFQRVTRIYPVYWLLCLMLLPLFFVKPEWINSSIEAPVSLLHSFLLLPHESAPLIMVAWTLEFEMFFYLIFALTLSLGTQRQIMAMTALFSTLALLGFYLKPLPEQAFLTLVTSPLLLEFIGGMWLAYIYDRLKPSLLLFGGMVVFAAWSCFIAYHAPDLERGLKFGIPALFILGAVLSGEKLGWRFPENLSKWGGNISYSMYLLHVLVIVALGRLWLAVGGMDFMSHGVLFSLMIAASLCGGTVLYYGFEKPIMKFLRTRYKAA